MSDAVQRLLVRIDATTEQLRRELKAAEKAVSDSDTRMQKAVASMGGAWKQADRWVQRHSAELKLIGTAAVASTGFAIKAIADYSDSFKSLQGQLKLVTNSQEELNSVWDSALDIANSTGSTLDATVTLYARMARSTEELGLSQQQMLDITKTVSQSMAVSGATTDEAARAIVQFSQALQGGKLRAEEYNSIVEQAPYLLQVMAEGVDKTGGQFRQMMLDGEVSTEVMISAIQKMTDSVDKDFGRLPLTVGRAMNEVRNQLLNAFGQADVEPLTRQIQEFGEVLKDPEVTRALTDIATGIVEFGTSTASALPKVVEFTQKFGEMLAAMRPGGQGSGSGTLAGFRAELEAVEGKLESATWRFFATGERIAEMEAKADMLRKSIGLLEESAANTSKATKSLGDETEKTTKAQEEQAKQVGEVSEATEELNEQTDIHVGLTEEQRKEVDQLVRSIEDLGKRHEKANQAINDGIQAIDDITRETEQYIEELEFELSLIGQSEREQAILTAAREKGAMATAEQRAEIERLTGEIYDSNAAMEASEESQKKMVDAIDGARSTLSDFFFEFAQDGKNAFDTLVDGFKAMITKMIAEAAANQIILGFGGIAGGLGFSSVANAATQAGGGGAGILGNIGSAAKGFFSPGGFSEAYGGIYSEAGNILSNLGFEGLGDLAYNQGLNIGNMSNLGAAGYGLLNAGAGFAGNYAAGLFTEGTSGIGSMLGGAAGSVFGPLGTAAGSFLGDIAEDLLGDVFGFGGKPGNNTGFAQFNTSTGSITSGGYGTYNPDNERAAVEIANIVQGFAEALGGSNFEGQLDVSDRGWVKFDNQRYEDTDELLGVLFDRVVDGADQLSDSVRELVQGFEGTTEQTVAYAQTLALITDQTEGIDDALVDMILAFEGSNEEIAAFSTAVVAMNTMLADNPVNQAIEEFEANAEAASRTLVSTYTNQLEAISKLVAEYDGTAASATALSAALAQNKETAYQLALAIKGVSESIGEMFAASAQQIRESVMSEEERMATWRARRDELMASLDDLFDPREIEETAQEVNRLNNQIFQALSQEQQEVQAEAFAQYAERTNEIAQTQLSAVLESARNSQEQLNNQLRGIMTSAASDFRSAAAQFTSAAQIIAAAAESFRSASFSSEVA